MLGSRRDPAVSWIVPKSVTRDASLHPGSLHGKQQTVHAYGAKAKLNQGEINSKQCGGAVGNQGPVLQGSF